MIPLHDIARRLAAGETSSTALIDTALSHAQAPDGEGHRVFTRLYADRARADAAAGDRARQAGRSGGTLAGLPISIKDLFDVAGETTWPRKMPRSSPGCVPPAPSSSARPT